MKRHIEAELEFETYYGTVSFEAGRWCRLLIDIEMKRSDELLAQMIPKAVADKVKKGLNPVDTCEVCKVYNHNRT